MDDAPKNRLTIATVGIVLFVIALCAMTCGDFGLTWDEPVYRSSQIRAAEWFRDLAQARSAQDLSKSFDASSLLHGWMYGRFGLNFHPPLAGILDLFTYETFGWVMKDIPARRMGAVLTFAGAVGLLFRFLGRRYGISTGLIAAGTLLLTPRVFADGQIGATDAPGLFFWPATALAFWVGMYEPGARGARIATGVCLGLAFLVKPVAFLVLLPLVFWFAASVLRPRRIKSWSRADCIDGLVTLLPLFAMLAVAFAEIRRLSAALPTPRTTLLTDLTVSSPFPDWAFGLPAAYWLFRRLLARLSGGNKVLGVERPAIETLAAALALAPLVIWLGNPEWWRDAWPRLGHYYALGMDRRDALPQMPVHYFGRSYLYSAPWESGWVWIAITTPLTLLVTELIGAIWGLTQVKRDRLPLFFLVNVATLPMTRLLPVPGHDGTRLMLPAFFFLAAFAGWGSILLAKGVARAWSAVRPEVWRVVVGLAVLVPPSVGLVRIHPYELSYYNALVGGPVGAWHRGLELTYWYDAFTPSAVRSMNDRLPLNSALLFANGLSAPFDYFSTLQQLGQIRSDIRFIAPAEQDFPAMLLLTADSKANAFSRLLFVMKPDWTVEPRQLNGARVLSLYGARTSAVALTLQMLLDVQAGQGAPHHRKFSAPAWMRDWAPFLARLRGDDTSDTAPLGINQVVLNWARTDSTSLLAAAKQLSEPGAHKRTDLDPKTNFLLQELRRFDSLRPYSPKILNGAPWSILEAAEILVRHPDAIQTALLNRGYTDPVLVGGYVDRDR